MKHLNFFITIFIAITILACSSDADENNPNLSFSIENGNRFASSEINITNTSTNYTGDYIWDVNSVFGTETFTSQNLTFNANRVSDYTISLRSESNDFETEQTISITQPSILVFNTITLIDIPQNYDALYFKLNRITINGATTVYTSGERQNISSLAPSVIDWDVDFPSNAVELTDGSDVNEIATYQVEFYDGNDNLVTKLNSFGNLYDMNSQYAAGEIELTTISSGCTNCDYFEVLADFAFRN
jgi:hypothetical protein